MVNTQSWRKSFLVLLKNYVFLILAKSVVVLINQFMVSLYPCQQLGLGPLLPIEVTLNLAYNFTYAKTSFKFSAFFNSPTAREGSFQMGTIKYCLLLIY